MRREFLFGALIITTLLAVLHYQMNVYWTWFLWLPILFLAFQDLMQKRHAIRRNFPLFGRFRYVLEAIRPEINQYFVESNSDGAPFSREERSLVYQRSKKELDTLPFGTQKNVYETGYEWINHSLLTTHIDPKSLRVEIGGSHCKKKYNASIFNISAMSYGALSKNAILALNGGAKDGNFAHNTGEGGLSPYHLESGGDLIWQIGTGYFSARDANGRFSESEFKKRATIENVKMIELKLSQGAKPGHGGILPAAKITKEISEIRKVPMGRDVLSPPSHSEFTTPIGLLEFIQKLQNLSEGKPVGFKLCIGRRREFLAICKAMVKTGIRPDFITIDGGEGGTGAAPLEFSNYVGSPGLEALIFAHNSLVGFNLRDEIKILTTGKVISGFGIIKRLCLGADALYAARSFMMSLGCIQALRCNSNHCPTGVATQNPQLVSGLVITDKRKRVANFHSETIRSAAELLGAMGLSSVSELKPWHISRRISPNVAKHFGEIYEFINKGSLLGSQIPSDYQRAMASSIAEGFRSPN